MCEVFVHFQLFLIKAGIDCFSMLFCQFFCRLFSVIFHRVFVGVWCVCVGFFFLSCFSRSRFSIKLMIHSESFRKMKTRLKRS